MIESNSSLNKYRTVKYTYIPIGIVNCTFYSVHTIDKDRHSANSSHETSIPKGSWVNTVHILQGLQGFVLNFEFGIYLDHIF